MFESLKEKIASSGIDIARMGIGFVFVWFGLSGIISPENWISMVPMWATAITSAHTLVVLHGIVELVFGFLFMINVWRKVSGLVLFVSIVQTLTIVGGPTLVRDISIAAAVFGLTVHRD
jgi:uncharacterized membrane protein YphA (DoxX/SURF4 family)